jgi:hypothetical protein
LRSSLLNNMKLVILPYLLCLSSGEIPIQEISTGISHALVTRSSGPKP